MTDAASLLDLPHPEAMGDSDWLLVNLYRRFLTELWSSENDTVVHCHAEFFSELIKEGSDGGGRIDLLRLRLLAALLRPGWAQLVKIRRRTHYVDRFDHQRGRFTGHIHDQSIARAVRSLREFAASDELLALGPKRGRSRVLGGIDYFMATAPGMTWRHELEVSSFGSEWALVLYYGDAEDRRTLAFPTILGFAARSAFPWSIAAVLAADSVFGTWEPEIESAHGFSAFEQRLLTFCWSRGEDGDSELASSVLRLNRREIRAFLKATAGLSYDAIARYVMWIQEDEEEEDFPDDLHPLSDDEMTILRRLAEW